MSVVQQLMRKARLMIGLGLVKLMDDARAIQQVQLTLLDGEVSSKVNRYQNYGHTSVPLVGAEAIAIAVGGNRNHLVVVACDDGRHRKNDLQPGESALYTDEGDYVLLKRGRIIEVLAGTKVQVTAPELEVVASTKVTITSPEVDMSGDLTVTGTIIGGTVKQGTVVLGTHSHTDPQGGTVGPPI